MFRSVLPLLVLALLRFVFLDARPIHHDEAVNGWFVDGLFREGFYSYDPNNYHGPLFFYLLALSESIFGRDVIALRIPAALFGTLLSLSPLLFRKRIGFLTAWIAALFLSVSPAFVFYSRYAIHETGFALACVLFFHQWLRIREDGWTGPRIAWLSLTVGLMASLKENFAIFGAALGIAELAVWRSDRRVSRVFTRAFWPGAFACLGLSLIPVLVFFTGFFQEWAGFAKFFEAFLKWFETGSHGNGHQKPFWYWIGLLFRYEWLPLVGLLALPFLAKRADRDARLAGVIGAVLWFMYSAVPYKTPWCMLSFAWFLAVFGASAISGAFSWMSSRVASGGLRLAAIALVAFAAIASAWQTVQVSWIDPDQDGHPYIYGQTYADFLPPVERILKKIKNEPALASTLRVQVVSEFTWPLPYLLGPVRRVGYHSQKNLPPLLDADVLILDENLLPGLLNRIRGDYSQEAVASRQWASRSVFLFRKALFP